MKTLFFLFTLVGTLQLNALTPPPPPETLPSGTFVFLELIEKVNSDQATVGKVLMFRVRTNVVVNGKTVITTGAMAIGKVKSIQETTYNIPEQITLTVTSVQAVDGQQVALNGIEQTFIGQFSGEGVTVEPGQPIIAGVMNNIDIDVP